MTRALCLMLVLSKAFLGCSLNDGHSGKTVGSETTNAMVIVNSAGSPASFARVYWVTARPYWYQEVLGSDSMWVRSAVADSNGVVQDVPEPSVALEMYIHWQDQSVRVQNPSTSGDTMQLALSGALQGRITGGLFPERICLAGSWICTSVDSVTGAYEFRDVPEGQYTLVGEAVDTAGVSSVFSLGAASIPRNKTVAQDLVYYPKGLLLFDFNDRQNFKSPLASDLGLKNGYGYVVFEGDIQVAIPAGADSATMRFSAYFEQDSSRENLGFHINMKTGSAFHYFQAGAQFDSTISFVAVDSIRFWSKGDCDAEVKLFENTATNFSANHRFTPDSVWRQYSLPTRNFQIANNMNPEDSLLDWLSAGREFNHIVFGSYGTCRELWVDDLEIMGASLIELLRF